VGDATTGLKLKATSPGAWGVRLRVTVTGYIAAPGDDLKKQLGLEKEEPVLSLTVRDPGRGLEERFDHLVLTVREHPRRLDKALKAESKLVRWDGDWPTKPDKLPTVAEKDTDLVTATENADGVELDEKLKAVAEAKNALAKANAKIPPVAAEVQTAEESLATAETALSKAEQKVQPERDKVGAADSQPLTAGGDWEGNLDQKTGLYALENTDLFNLLCIPPDNRDGTTPAGAYKKALEYCVRRRALLIVDPPADWPDAATALEKLKDLFLTGPEARNAAIYFPRIQQATGEGELVSAVPCGVIAGIMARTDTQRGVWKAPAGVDANLSGVDGLALNLTNEQNGDLNDLGINALRTFPVTGRVAWGARTMRGANQLGDEYRYIPVRRLALFLEESLYRGTKWAVFEPNDEPLWAQIRLNVGAFLQNLFRQGAFQGRSPREAYFVKCDKDTTTQNDINLGIVNVLVGFAPLKPAEFVIIKLQQLAGQIEA
jgi:hypothetical protein